MDLSDATSAILFAVHSSIGTGLANRSKLCSCSEESRRALPDIQLGEQEL